MRSAITISLVPEAAGGPFVFWNDLNAATAKAHDLGFDAIEIFTPDSSSVANADVAQTLHRTRLDLAAVGTGAGWVKHRLSLTSPDPLIRVRAREFIAGIIDAAAQYNAPAIIGSLQGRAEPNTTRDQQIVWLREALAELAAYAAGKNQTLLFEPLNRYETNLINNLTQGVELITAIGRENLRLLSDIFHANIEEADIAASLRAAGPAIGHIHFADSNRRAVGLGHIDYKPIIAALRDINYQGYLSAEILPLPDSAAAAKQTIESFQALTS